MTSLPRIKSSNSLNKSDSKSNLLESFTKSNSSQEILSDNNVVYFSEQKIFEDVPWEPPSINGLTNSEPIIPSYYLKKIEELVDENGIPIKYMNIDYVTIIKDQIRNLRKLNEHQIRYIKIHMDDKTKNEIIDEYIKALNICIDIFTS